MADHVFDLTRATTQRAVLGLLRTGRIWYVHVGPPRKVVSRARHNIRNLAKSSEAERVGVELAIFTTEVWRRLLRLEGYWCIGIHIAQIHLSPRQEPVASSAASALLQKFVKALDRLP